MSRKHIEDKDHTHKTLKDHTEDKDHINSTITW